MASENKVATLVTDGDKFKQQAIDLLEEAKDQGFVEVVIVGRRNDDSVGWQRSGTMSFLRMIGALEWAKHDAINQWRRET